MINKVWSYKPQTKEGLKNMVGNVWEWVQDWWQVRHNNHDPENPVCLNFIVHLFNIRLIVTTVHYNILSGASVNMGHAFLSGFPLPEIQDFKFHLENIFVFVI